MLSQDLYTTRNVCERVWLTSMMWASKEAELAHLHFPLVPQIQVKTRFIIVFFLPLYLQKTKKLCFSSVICLKWHYIQTWGLAVILVPFFHSSPTSNLFLSAVFHIYSIISIHVLFKTFPHLFFHLPVPPMAWVIFKRQIWSCHSLSKIFSDHQI